MTFSLRAQEYENEKTKQLKNSWVEAQVLKDFFTDDTFIVQPFFDNDNPESEASQLVIEIYEENGAYYEASRFLFPCWFGLNQVVRTTNDTGWELCSYYPWRSYTFCAQYDENNKLLSIEEIDYTELAVASAWEDLEEKEICEAANTFSILPHWRDFLYDEQLVLTFMKACLEAAEPETTPEAKKRNLERYDCVFEVFIIEGNELDEAIKYADDISEEETTKAFRHYAVLLKEAKREIPDIVKNRLNKS